MIRYSDNPILANMLDLLFDKTQVIARRVVILPGRITEALKMHSEMLHAMQRRDSEEAERSRRRILSSARDMLGRYQRFVL
jgi:DNA-binding GntR family transcriptional regulator